MRKIFILVALHQYHIHIPHRTQQLLQTQLPLLDICGLFGRAYHAYIRTRIGEAPGVLALMVYFKAVAVMLDHGKAHSAAFQLPNKLFYQSCLARARIGRKSDNRNLGHGSASYLVHVSVRSASFSGGKRGMAGGLCQN